jgi:hypothetical protein
VIFDIDGDPGWAGVFDLFDHDIPPTYRVSTDKGHHLYYATRHNYKSKTRLFPEDQGGRTVTRVRVRAVDQQVGTAPSKRGRWYVVPGNWNTIRDRIRRSGYLGMLLERHDAPFFLTTKPDEGGKRLPDTAAAIEVVTDAVRHIPPTRRIRMVGR